MRVHITSRSSNAKTGPIPVTTSEQSSCAPSCPFIDKGCYAKSGPLALHWRKVSEGERGTDWRGLCDFIQSLPAKQLWRHNQAGDLQGNGDVIEPFALRQLVNANRGKRGFTYTHKPMDSAENRDAVKHANENGFTVNLSANTPKEADNLASLNVGPVVVVLPIDATENTTTPQGRKIVVCPATQRDNVSCATCKLCAIAERDFIVGFPAHGNGKKKAEQIALA